jgi:hypothetical protein
MTLTPTHSSSLLKRVQGSHSNNLIGFIGFYVHPWTQAYSTVSQDHYIQNYKKELTTCLRQERQKSNLTSEIS